MTTTDGVKRYLVTADIHARMKLWMVTAFVANWIEGRDNDPDGTGIQRQTWLVTIFMEQSSDFLDLARYVNQTEDGPLTVQEVKGAGESEQYEYVVGPQGSGWESEQ